MDWGRMLYDYFVQTIVFWCCISSVYTAGKGSGNRKSGTKSSKWNPVEKEMVNQTTKEAGPKFTFSAWDDGGKICILAKLEAVFTITFESNYGQQHLTMKLPRDLTVKGRCPNLLDRKPILDLHWRGGFTFRMVFGMREATHSWGIDDMYLVYNTKDSAFSESINGGPMTARSDADSLKQFETLLGHSYYCPSPSIINMYVGDDRTVIVRMSTVQLQAYRIENGKFSPMSRCGLVGFGSGVIAPFYLMNYHEDDSAALIVGVMMIFVSLGTIAGFAVYRSYFFKKTEYDTMI
ncbi:lysosome-associated membrane glycoprotein 5 [Brevipalpus obovatus]|uniref:lysosome-associated membrane glycoprotein 5 n=1 Tax=Brevipalpus obovatus TaxID=246614 RepID=UPI003D9DD450